MRILIIEDEFLIASYLEDVLEELGYDEIYTAHTLAAGHSYLEAVHPDFAILDVNVGPDLVYPLANEMLARKIPFIFSTGQPADALPPEWREHPNIPKPLQKEALAAMLQGLGLAGDGPQPGPRQDI